MGKRKNYSLYLVSIFTLGLGVLVYVLDRPVADVYMLPAWLADMQTAPGGLHDSLPSLLHAFAFCLLLLLTNRTAQISAKVWVCAGWWLIAVGLEFLQHSSISPLFLQYSPGWLAKIPVLQNLPDYALRGTFDGWDILFAALGCAAALLIEGKGWQGPNPTVAGEQHR